jgi:imidazoleglycerol phosphate dehydratase HisB
MNAGQMNLHVNQRYGRNAHHIIEATFKGLARALRQAVAIDPRVRGVPSTKGTLREPLQKATTRELSASRESKR